MPCHRQKFQTCHGAPSNLSYKFVITFLMPLSRSKSFTDSNGLMIKPKLLLSPVFKDLSKSKTTHPSHSSPKETLHRRQSGLPYSPSPQCFRFAIFLPGRFPKPSSPTPCPSSHKKSLNFAHGDTATSAEFAQHLQHILCFQDHHEIGSDHLPY